MKQRDAKIPIFHIRGIPEHVFYMIIYFIYLNIIIKNNQAYYFCLVNVNDCLSDTLKKANSDLNLSLQTSILACNTLFFAHLNINSLRKKIAIELLFQH